MKKRPVILCFALLLFLGSLCLSAAHACPAGAGSSTEEEGEKDPGLWILGGRAKIAAIPIPGYNEAIGWSLGLMGAAYYKVNEADTVSPESVTALFGFYAENETWAGGAFQKLHLSEDRWRIGFGAAAAKVNFQAYFGFPGWIGGGRFIDYTTETTFGIANVSRRAWRKLYIGAKYRFMRSETEFHTILPIDLDKRTFSGVGAIATWDSRDNIFYPRSGYLLDFGSLWNVDWIGSDQDYEIYEYQVSGYRGFRERHVIAARVHSRFAAGDVPFEDESVFYYMDLRGYTDGRYRADQRHTVQAEYKWMFYRRFSAAAFGGFGWSVDKVRDIRWDGILPSAGLGVRWMMIKDPPVNIGVDFAWGKDDNAFYFRIGESF